MKKLILIFFIIFLLQGCVFTGYGVNYETEYLVTISAKEEGKMFNAVISIKDEPGTLKDILAEIKEMFQNWTKSEE